MIVFKYRAKDFDGNIKRGAIATDSVEEFLAKLKSERLFCLSYTSEEKIIKQKEVYLSSKELFFFCEQLATMLTSGMTVIKSLELICDKCKNVKQRRIFMSLYEEVQKGKSLSEAMVMQGVTFPTTVVNMVTYGEMSGNIANAMKKLSENYSKEIALNASVKSAMAYPVILAVISTLVVVVLLTTVLPMITNMFDPEDLPWTTKLLSAISASIINYWYIYALVIFTVVVGFKVLKKNASFRMKIDKFKVKVPIFGKLNRVVATSRFARTLASLYSSGIPLIDSLGIAIKVTGNLYMEEKFKDVILKVRQGTDLSAAIAESELFDDTFNQMLFVGEQSGELDSVLVKTSNYYDDQAQNALKRMVTYIQPIMIVFMALIIGFIIISILTPMYSIYEM